MNSDAQKIDNTGNEMRNSVLRVGSFNIRGANTYGKLDRLCLWAEDENMDIIGIQETKLLKEKTRQLFQVEDKPDC